MSRVLGFLAAIAVVAATLSNGVLAAAAVLLGAVALTYMTLRSVRADEAPAGVRAGRRPAIVVRVGALTGTVAGGLVVAYVLWRYPAAAGGAGGPFYLGLVILLLCAYAAAGVFATGAVDGSALRYGGGYGLAAGALAAAAAMPVGGLASLDRWGRVALNLAVLVAIGCAVVAAAVHATRRAGPAGALPAGVVAGAAAALLAFLVDVSAAAAAPARLALDSDVVAHHSGADLVAANLGETAVLYILALVAGPLLGMIGGAVGLAVAQPVPRTARPE
jgi:hypothetical protein